MIISKDEMYIISQFINSEEIINYEIYTRSILHNKLIDKLFYLSYTGEINLKPSKFVNIVNTGYYADCNNIIIESIKNYMQDYIAINYKYIADKLNWSIMKDLSPIIKVTTLSNIVNATHNINYINNLPVIDALFVIRQYRKNLNDNVFFVERLCSAIYIGNAPLKIKKLMLVELLRFKTNDFKDSNKVLFRVLSMLKQHEKQFVYKYFKYNFIIKLPINYLLEFCILFNKQVSEDIKHILCDRITSDNLQDLKYCLNNIHLDCDDTNKVKAKILLAELNEPS